MKRKSTMFAGNMDDNAEGKFGERADDRLADPWTVAISFEKCFDTAHMFWA
jgi:hypothetical protein